MAAQPNCDGIDTENERRAASGGKGGGGAIPADIGTLETMDDGQTGSDIYGQDGFKIFRFVQECWFSNLLFNWVWPALALFPFYGPVHVCGAVVFVAFMYIATLADCYTDWRKKGKMHLDLLWVDMPWLCIISVSLWWILGMNDLEWVTPAWGRRGLLWGAETSFLSLSVLKFHVALLVRYTSPGEGFPSAYVMSGCVSTVLGILLGMYYYMVASNRWVDSPWRHHPVAMSAILAHFVVAYKFLPRPHGIVTEHLLS